MKRLSTTDLADSTDYLVVFSMEFGTIAMKVFYHEWHESIGRDVSPKRPARLTLFSQ